MNPRRLVLAMAVATSAVFGVMYSRAVWSELTSADARRTHPGHELPPPVAVPHPEFTAADVAELLLGGLSHNDLPYPNAGVATLWAFTADGYRGSGQREFLSMATASVFYPLYRQSLRQVVAVAESPTRVNFAVQVVDTDGQTFHYRLELHRRFDGRYAGCWRVSGLFPEWRAEPPGTFVPGDRDGNP
ncbi:MAG: hypothetical protein ACK4PI_00785 [Tepidisphaerales bacterium]